jgi:hypothetical protein
MKTIYLLLCAALFVGGCTNSERDVKTSVVYFYTNLQPDHRNVDTKLLSKSLVALLEKARLREVLEADKVAKSASPSDKPVHIELNVFASHLEGGVFSFAVNNISINEDTAVVTMDFAETWPDKKVYPWTEKVILIKEDGWKIDDIVYPPGDRYLDGGGNLKKVLSKFINGA